MFYLQEIIHYVQSNFVLVASLSATAKWLWEYTQSRKFERNRFLLERIEKFNSLESTQKVKKLLDWNKISIDIGGILHKIDDVFLIESLKTNDEKGVFDTHEVYIREIFDDYFDGLSELITLSDTGLVDKKNLKKFLKYWIDILNGTKKNKPKVFVEVIKNYLEYYEYSDILRFIK